MTEPTSSALRHGDAAPALELVDQDGAAVSLADFAGTGVVVYFYPKAATPGCTTEACDFRDSLASLQGLGYAVVGVSPDAPEALTAFAGDHSLGFPLLSDPDGTAARAWGRGPTARSPARPWSSMPGATSSSRSTALPLRGMSRRSATLSRGTLDM
ncbi:hypothetical protein GCM10025865_27380 [Paraoerskovia sediminicola]|uniref:thioredoxin-dependent peroxiredoxin n=1 Tax=Paraoerskovia sediminicola TaxID=1138587 RepID=A0ABM8G5N6_9CELL|nr:hypothetical protein GCM10025865_27380 [Paraoerskovia sediminicola]